MKQLVRIALLLTVVLGSACFVNSASVEPKPGGTITLAISKDMALMNPLVATGSTEARIRELMFESLLGLDARGNIRPNIAESWDVSKDGKVYTFKLRRGVRFHDGKEMTAADVKFAIDYTMDAKNGATGYDTLSVVDRVELPDPLTVKLYLKRPDPLFLTWLSDIRAFSVIPKGSLAEGVRQPKSMPPGTGPFKFVEWQPRQRVILARHDQYWGPKAFVDRVVLRDIANATVRINALQSGDVDIIERTPYEWVKEIVDGKTKGIGYSKASLAGARNVEFNVAAPPFNNKKLRLAVAHAIDRKEILQGAYLGLAEASDQRYPKGHTWYFVDVRAPEYDLSKAKALLQESGYKGETIELMGNVGEAAEVEGAVIQAQLKRIGIKVQLKMFERASALEARRKGNYAFKLSGGREYPEPIPLLQEYRCEPDLNNRRENESGYCNKQFDALLAEAEAQSDIEKRRVLYRRLTAMQMEDMPILPIGFTPRFFAFRSHVKGFQTDFSGAFQWGEGGLSHTWIDK
jgi:ABC-type transport system substrate-binding protein